MADGRARGAESTRKAIIEAALQGFAEEGFAATSTRRIAALAGTNIASIAYHFGGKEGLRRACAEHAVALIGEVVEAGEATTLPSTPDAAALLLEALLRRFATFLLLEPRAGPMVGFLQRELAVESETLDIVYSGVIERVHRRLCLIWQVATGRDAEGPAVKLAVFAMVGQMLYFRIARPIVARRLGWGSVGPDEAAAILEAAVLNLRARIAAEREGLQ